MFFTFLMYIFFYLLIRTKAHNNTSQPLFFFLLLEHLYAQLSFQHLLTPPKKKFSYFLIFFSSFAYVERFTSPPTYEKKHLFIYS